MAVTATPQHTGSAASRAPVQPELIARLRRPRGRVQRSADSAFQGGSLLFALVVVGVLGLMLWQTTLTALPVLRAEGARFVTGTHWEPAAGRFEALPFL